MDGASLNLFPRPLRQAAMELFAAEALGAALLRQRPEIESGGKAGPHAAPLDQDLARLLHHRERARGESYRLAKRRNEFLLGRVSAKLALAEYWAAEGCHPPLAEVEIVNDATGRPAVDRAACQEGASPPPAEVSISHGGEFAAALAAAAPCGIDLQEQKDTLLRVLDKYCSGEEERVLRTGLPELAPLVRLSLLWTAKEAAKKACSQCWMPGFLDLRLTEPVQSQPGCHILTLAVSGAPADCSPTGEITVLATTCNEYGLAVCILSEARCHAGTAGS